MEPDDLLCSRNARPEKALVGRAQWKINQPPFLKRERASLEGALDCNLIGLLCSQRAHDKNVLPRCAQWETDSGLPLGK